MSGHPSFGNDLPAAQLARRVDRLCDRFEAAWKAGQRPRLERYLAKSPPSVQSELLRELLVLELEYRYQSGEKPQPEEYRLRFPQHGELIDTVFSEATQSAPSSPYLLRRWTMSRLVSQLRMLAFPEEQGKDQPPEVLSLLGEILSRTAGERRRAPGETPLASSELDTPTKLLKLGEEADTKVQGEARPDRETLPVTVLGDYELLDLLGKGGMGIVYRARQRSANRIVALKVIRSDRLEQLPGAERQEWFERFRREAQIAASLDHDNLVTVHEVGQAGGQHFYSMRFVDGQSLGEILRQGPVPNQRAALYLEQVARAVHALHLRGIVHRDLKPRNILVDTNDRPFVTDFGLAKGPEYTRGLTHLGQCVGTPEYMSPEHVRNPAGVQAASDLYSLGATLYELLTARPPFTAADPVETLRQVQDEEPLSPRRLNPAVHRDLELICLKCLEKEPHKRYASALEVAEELRRYRSGEPLRHTRPVGKPERVWRWCRRKPALAAASSLALVALIAVVISVGVATYQSHAFVMYQSRVIAEQQLQLAESALDKGIGLCTQGEVREGMVWLARSLELAPPVAEDIDRVARASLAGWGRQLSPLKAVLLHQDGIVALAFSSNGQAILTASGDQIHRWDAATGKPDGPPLTCREEVIAFSPDGKTFLTKNANTAQLWETDTGKAIGMKFQHADTILAAAFSPDRSIVVTAGRDKTARLWQAATTKALGPPLQHEKEICAVAVGPDGKTVLTGSLDNYAQLWDGVSGERLGSPLDVRPKDRLKDRVHVRAIAFSPDGKTVLTGDDDNVARLWEVATRRPIGQPLPHRGRITSVAFSPNGRMLVTGSEDNSCQLWETASGKPLCPPLQHEDVVRCVCFGPDSKMVLTGCADKTARLWQVPSTELPGHSLPHRRFVQVAVFSPDGKTVLTGTGLVVGSKLVNDREQGEALLWDVATGKPLGPPLVHLGPVRAGAFSPDGKTIVTGSRDKTARIWDASTGNLRHLLPHTHEVQGVAFSADGKVVLTGSGDAKIGTGQLWDVRTGRPLAPPLHHNAEVRAVAISPSGDTLLTSSLDGTAQLWDASTGLPLAPPLMHQHWVYAAVFSPDGNFVLTGSADGTAQLWDARTGQRLGLSHRHRAIGRPLASTEDDAVFGVAFSPDGKTLLTGGNDRVARLWELPTGQPLTPPMQHQGAVRGVQFSRDGRLVLTRSDNTARVWDTATGRSLGPPLIHQKTITSACFSPDGKTVLTGSNDTTARLWELPVPLEDAREQIVLRTKVSTGMAIGEDGLVHVMDAKAWLQNRELLE